MPFQLRPRRLAQAALTVAMVALVAACGKSYPDSIFHNRTDFNRDVDFLFRILIWAGVAVFIFVEAVLVWAIVIFSFSTSYFSAENTSKFIDPILRFLMPGASAATIALGHAFVRKAAHFTNCVEAVRANSRERQNADVEEGHFSSALCHLGNISHRSGEDATPLRG